MLTAFDNIIKIQKYFVNDCASVGKKSGFHRQML